MPSNVIEELELDSIAAKRLLLLTYVRNAYML
jgi:hypothetical protein